MAIGQKVCFLLENVSYCVKTMVSVDRAYCFQDGMAVCVAFSGFHGG